jgi:hypothetical protein
VGLVNTLGPRALGAIIVTLSSSLFWIASSLCGSSVKGLYEKVTGKDGPFKKDPFWENMLNSSIHRRLLHRLV